MALIFYAVAFAAFALPAAWLEYRDNGCFGLRDGQLGLRSDQSKAYYRFRNNYVLVFSLMMAGDWLQGPYVYHLYEHYDYSVRDIGRLFIMGFGSSAIFGTIAGSLADRYGRKAAALSYVVLYSLSCATKHSPDFWVLLVGRLLGGISTSLLFSVFEAWAVAAHNAAGFEEKLLGDVFTKAVFMGNGVMAIASGLVGNLLVDVLHLGPVAPFDVAAVVLLAGGAVIASTWKENYGSVDDDDGGEADKDVERARQRVAGSILMELVNAIAAVSQDERVALLGAVQSFFESAMYAWIFLWTPALGAHGKHLPHGFIFATFMTASMVGTAMAGRVMRATAGGGTNMRIEMVLMWVFVASAGCMMVAVPFHLDLHREELDEGLEDAYEAGGEITAPDASTRLSIAGRVQLVAFCIFEVCIGLFWPAMMALRARYVPEEARATIANVFRVPLNVAVCVILWNVSEYPLAVMFFACVCLLLAAAVCQWRLAHITRVWSSTARAPTNSPNTKAADHEPLKAAHGTDAHIRPRTKPSP